MEFEMMRLNKLLMTPPTRVQKKAQDAAQKKADAEMQKALDKVRGIGMQGLP